jgi:hypothetical protein
MGYCNSSTVPTLLFPKTFFLFFFYFQKVTMYNQLLQFIILIIGGQATCWLICLQSIYQFLSLQSRILRVGNKYINLSTSQEVETYMITSFTIRERKQVRLSNWLYSLVLWLVLASKAYHISKRLFISVAFCWE